MKLIDKLKNIYNLINVSSSDLKDLINDNNANKKFLLQNIEVQKGTKVSSDCEIGSYTYIGYNCTLTKCKIGRYCSIANNVSIGVGEHKTDKISTSSLFYENPYDVLTEGQCIIGNDVWIGTNSVIRRGTTVGNGVIIGANSFVNIDLPSYSIAVGSPVIIKKYRFSNEGIKILENNQWWNLNFEESKNKLKDLEIILSQNSIL